MNSQIAEAERVDVGERLRAIRRLRRATLKTVADRAGLSESFLSQVERGRANASVASLKRIAAALGVNVADLFEPNGSADEEAARAPSRGSTDARVRDAGPEVHAHAETAREPRRSCVGELDAGGRPATSRTRTETRRSSSSFSRASCRCSSASEMYELDDRRLASTTGASTPHRLVNIGGDASGGDVDHQPTELLAC